MTTSLSATSSPYSSFTPPASPNPLLSYPPPNLSSHESAAQAGGQNSLPSLQTVSDVSPSGSSHNSFNVDGTNQPTEALIGGLSMEQRIALEEDLVCKRRWFCLLPPLLSAATLALSESGTNYAFRDNHSLMGRVALIGECITLAGALAWGTVSSLTRKCLHPGKGARKIDIVIGSLAVASGAISIASGAPVIGGAQLVCGSIMFLHGYMNPKRIRSLKDCCSKVGSCFSKIFGC